MVSASNIRIFDRALIRRNRERAQDNFQQHSFLSDWANARIAERLDDVKREFPLALQIGPSGSTM
jgi:NADH dehydrogenase [ubiquinone] 1 alpha subcomplex assembly factor 5